jgi:hypothetical protein
MANVKHIANLAGKTAISGAKNTHMKIKKAATPKEIIPPIQFLSFGKKLKMERHPYGSGSCLPSTKLRAFDIIPETPDLPEDCGCVSISIELEVLIDPPNGFFGFAFWTKSFHLDADIYAN